MSPYGSDMTWSSGRIASPSLASQACAAWAAACTTGSSSSRSSGLSASLSSGSAVGVSVGCSVGVLLADGVLGRLVLAVLLAACRLAASDLGGLPSASRRTASMSAGSTTQVTVRSPELAPKSTSERSRPPWERVWVQLARSSSEPSSV